jgi:beta-lactamase class A
VTPRLKVPGAALAATIAVALPIAPADANVTPKEARKWEPDISAARDYANSRAGEVGFAVFDMRGRLHHSGGGGRARMASTFKVMLMVAYLRQGNVEDRALTSYEKSLMRPMIRRSANQPATTIRDMLGRGPIERLAHRARMKSFVWDDIWGYCKTSARDQAFFLRNLRRFVPERHWAFARRHLANVIPAQRWGVGQADPDGWKLLFKGGWGSGTGLVDHQVAQLRRGKRRIGVAVLTEGNPSHQYGNATLEGVFRRLLRGLPL